MNISQFQKCISKSQEPDKNLTLDKQSITTNAIDNEKSYQTFEGGLLPFRHGDVHHCVLDLWRAAGVHWVIIVIITKNYYDDGHLGGDDNDDDHDVEE